MLVICYIYTKIDGQQISENVLWMCFTHFFEYKIFPYISLFDRIFNGSTLCSL